MTRYMCPRCGKKVEQESIYAPCKPCRIELRRIAEDRRRVFFASLAHLETDKFNGWLTAPNEELGGDSPAQWIEAGFADQVIDLVKTYKREGVVSALETVVSVEP